MPSPESVVSISRIVTVILLGLATASSMAGRGREAKFFLWLSFGAAVVFFSVRAYLKNFFPFTDRIESFFTLSMLIALVALVYRAKLANRELAGLLVLSLASALTTFVFTDQIRYPPVFLHTVWYPAHVPLSFAAYAFWFVAGVNALFSYSAWRAGDPALYHGSLMTAVNRNGFVFFTLAMLFGGIWGYLAWGHYFMWDPKLVWSVILWLYFGNLLHIDYLPKLRHWKVPLYVLGMVLILITFIGTGFFTRSIHKF